MDEVASIAYVRSYPWIRFFNPLFVSQRTPANVEITGNGKVRGNPRAGPRYPSAVT